MTALRTSQPALPQMVSATLLHLCEGYDYLAGEMAHAIARFLRYGDGLVALVAVLGMVALPAAFVVVFAGLSLLIG